MDSTCIFATTILLVEIADNVILITLVHVHVPAFLNGMTQHDAGFFPSHDCG